MKFCLVRPTEQFQVPQFIWKELRTCVLLGLLYSRCIWLPLHMVNLQLSIMNAMINCVQRQQFLEALSSMQWRHNWIMSLNYLLVQSFTEWWPWRVILFSVQLDICVLQVCTLFLCIFQKQDCTLFCQLYTVTFCSIPPFYGNLQFYTESFPIQVWNEPLQIIGKTANFSWCTDAFNLFAYFRLFQKPFD